MTRWLTAFVAVALVGAGAWYYLNYGAELPSLPATQQGNLPEPTNFIDCMRRFPVRGSPPRTCTTDYGLVYTEDIGNATALQDRIKVSNPSPNQIVYSPLSVQGQARSDWYDNGGSFKVMLYDSSGNLLGHASLQANSYWDTANFVKFSGFVTFGPPHTASSGKLVLSPGSGSEDPLVIPVLFR